MVDMILLYFLESVCMWVLITSAGCVTTAAMLPAARPQTKYNCGWRVSSYTPGKENVTRLSFLRITRSLMNILLSKINLNYMHLHLLLQCHNKYTAKSWCLHNTTRTDLQSVDRAVANCSLAVSWRVHQNTKANVTSCKRTGIEVLNRYIYKKKLN